MSASDGSPVAAKASLSFARSATISLFATSGSLTVTEIPSVLRPVSLGATGAPARLFGLAPSGTRLAKPPTLSLPNSFGLPPGRHAVLYGYNASSLQLERVGIGLREDRD